MTDIMKKPAKQDNESAQSPTLEKSTWSNRYTAAYEKHGEWWIARVEELSGAYTQGRTLDEARANLKDAVEMLLDVNREIASEDTEGRIILREDLIVDVSRT